MVAATLYLCFWVTCFKSHGHFAYLGGHILQSKQYDIYIVKPYVIDFVYSGGLVKEEPKNHFKFKKSLNSREVRRQNDV